MTHGLYPNGASPLSYIMLFPPHGTRKRVVFDNFNTRSHTHLIISIRIIHVFSWAQPITVPETQRAWMPANQILMPNVIDFITFFPFPESLRARASCLGRDRAGRSNCTESSENRCAQRRYGLEPAPRNPASNSHGQLRSGVDLFGRASRGHIATLKVP